MATLLEVGRLAYNSRLLVQDELSAHFDIQLALLTEEGVERTTKAIRSYFSDSEIDEIERQIDEEEFFTKDSLEEWRAILIDRGNDFDEKLLIEFSGESPVLQITRTSYHYRILETVLIAFSIEKFGQNPGRDILNVPVPSGVEDCLHARISRSAAWRGYIVSGPAFVSSGPRELRTHVRDSKISPFSTVASVFLQEHELERIERYGILRSEISTQDSDNRTRSLEAVIKSFSSIDLGDWHYESSIIGSITKAVVEFWIAAQRPSGEVCEAEHIQLIEYREGTHEAGSRTSDSLLSLQLKSSQSGITGIGIVKSRNEVSSSDHPRVDQRLSRISDRAHTNKIDQRLENLLVFRGWIFDYMGDANPGNSSPDLNHRFSRLNSFVLEKGEIVQAIACLWLWKILRSDIVTFYRLDHSTHTLRAEAYYARSQKHTAWAEHHASIVKDLGNAVDPQSSYLYQACSDGKSMISNHGQEISTGEYLEPKLQPLSASELESPSSFFIVPVKHGNRVIGLIECLSFRPFAFDDFSNTLIDEFCELLGKYFIAQRNAELVEHIRSSMAPTKWTKPKGSRFDELAVAIAEYFMVHSASVWIVDPFDLERLNLEGMLNRPMPPHTVLKAGARLGLRLDSDDTATSKAIERRTWHFGEIGLGEFGAAWLEDPAHLCMKDEGFNYIAVVPVLGQNNSPLASVTLLSKLAPFSEDLRPQVEFCARIIATALADMALVERVLIDGLSETSHEIRNIARHLKTATKKLAASALSPDTAFQIADDQVDPNDVFDPRELYLDDIQSFAADLETINDVMEPANFLKLYSDASFRGSPLVRHLIDEIGIREHSLREIWLSEFKSFSGEISRRQLDFDVKWTEGRVKVSIDRKMTSIVLRNILGNAVKYSPVGTKVSVKIVENTSRHNYVLTVSNYGPKLEPDEIERLFLRRFQGHRARNMSGEGRGEGLYQAHALMSAQGGLLKHSQDETDTRGEYVKHQFSLTFYY